MSNRTLVWFSCGAASAVAAKYAVEKYSNSTEVCYCDTLAYEHPDNIRFLKDVEKWIERPIKILKSKKYSDIYDVFRKTRYLVGPHFAPCTQELKRKVRKEYEKPGDRHIFGFTVEEAERIERFDTQEPTILAEFPLFDKGITKNDCYKILQGAGISLPEMYKLGYNNNNCIGCVKGGMGYWNKIRIDFPDTFNKMAKLERELGATILSSRKRGIRTRLYLDELDPNAGHDVPMPDIECGVICVREEEKNGTI